MLSDAPLSITTAPHGPYADTFAAGNLRYAYRGTDPQHPDNRGLRLAMERRLPLVYLFGLVPGRYFAVWPVFVVGDSPTNLFFEVAVDDVQFGLAPHADVQNRLAEERDADPAAVRNGHRSASIASAGVPRPGNRGYREQSRSVACATVEQRHFEAAVTTLRKAGYRDVPRDDIRPWKFVLGDDEGTKSTCPIAVVGSVTAVIGDMVSISEQGSAARCLADQRRSGRHLGARLSCGRPS